MFNGKNFMVTRTYVHPECTCVTRPSVWLIGTECVSCSRDNCPKVCSCDNNMQPGPVPQELLVTITGNYYILAYAAAFTILRAGTDISGGNANLSCHANHVTLQTSSWAVWLHWTCCQLATGCVLLCHSLLQLPFEIIIIFIFNKTISVLRTPARQQCQTLD